MIYSLLVQFKNSGTEICYSKTTKDVVEFYYFWKKSAHYEMVFSTILLVLPYSTSVSLFSPVAVSSCFCVGNANQS